MTHSSSYSSWGNYPHSEQQSISIHSRLTALPVTKDKQSLLTYGQGRSYGDVCQNDGGFILDASQLDHFISFDSERGILRCESGVTFENILRLITPRGWFLPVTPGTKFISVGGAIANDVHGKNHHRAGSFGCHITCFELLRSDGTRHLCNEQENPDLFNATIGGLGLTGLITWAEFHLKKIPGEYLQQETIRFKNLDEFFSLSESSDNNWEYTVSWIDCLAKGESLGRGLFMRANHSDVTLQTKTPRSLSMPFNAPSFTLNNLTVKAFNTLYYNRPVQKVATVHYDPFFYPLDSIQNWNRLYGKRGFLQYQCYIPAENAKNAIHKILETIARSGQGSFLSVLKQFGSIPSRGLMSFPHEGTTLALDFPIKGNKTFALLEQLDTITMENKGAVYPAKDARMSKQAFECYFPKLEKFAAFIDPAFSSGFWRRVHPG